ncbi:MAG: hypothetical protein C4303_01880 [candidate division GAL15 bacterium]
MPSDEERAVLQQVEAFVHAWNRGMPGPLPPSTRRMVCALGAFGEEARGRAQIEAAFEELLRKTMAGATVRMEPGSVRMLSLEFWVWQGRFEIALPDQKTALKGHAVQVMQEVQGRWRVLEGHPKLFPSRAQ